MAPLEIDTVYQPSEAFVRCANRVELAVFRIGQEVLPVIEPIDVTRMFPPTSLDVPSVDTQIQPLIDTAKPAIN